MTALKRISALLTACVMLALPLCGCGDDGKLIVTMRTVSTLGDEAEYNIYSGLLGEFSASAPDIYVRDTTVPTADAFRLNASEPAAYKAADAPHVVYFTNDGGLSEVTEYLVSVDEIISDYPDFVSGVSIEVLNSMRLDDGRVYCVPVMGEWTALVVNKALFEEHYAAIPSDWSSLLDAVARFSSAGVIPFANSADDGAAFIEAMVTAFGGSGAAELGLEGYSNIIEPVWRQALEGYSELCRRGAFAPAAVTEAIAAALTPVSATDIDLSGAPEAYNDALGFSRDRSLRTNAYDLFNNGLAAMILLDKDDISGIKYTEDCEIIRFPSPFGGGSAALPGGFRSGFAITRKAYEDPNLREAVVGFVDFMTGADASGRFAALGWLPANSGAAVQGMMSSVCGVRDNSYDLSTRSGANLSKWNSIDRMAGQLYYGMMSPQDICAALANPELVWVDPNTVVPVEEPVSETDLPAVSSSDAVSFSDVD